MLNVDERCPLEHQDDARDGHDEAQEERGYRQDPCPLANYSKLSCRGLIPSAKHLPHCSEVDDPTGRYQERAFGEHEPHPQAHCQRAGRVSALAREWKSDSRAISSSLRSLTERCESTRSTWQVEGNSASHRSCPRRLRPSVCGSSYPAAQFKNAMCCA